MTVYKFSFELETRKKAVYLDISEAIKDKIHATRVEDMNYELSERTYEATE